MILDLIASAVRDGATQARACEVLGLDPSTVQRWQRCPDGDDLRRGKTRPANALTQEEQAKILELATAPEFVGLSPHQLVAKLADMSMFVGSEASIYRLLPRHRLLKHRDRSKLRTHRRPRELVATGPNQVWAWDITYLPAGVRGTFWYLYAILDVWSRKVVGWAVHDVQSDDLAAALVDETCAREGVVREQLVLHSDNGAAMKGKTMLVKLEQLGVLPSFSRPRVSDGNPFPEALFRTLKYRPSYPDKPFVTLQDARCWVTTFVGWYNDDHLHSGIRFVTPTQRHSLTARRSIATLVAVPDRVGVAALATGRPFRRCVSTRSTASTRNTHAATILTLTARVNGWMVDCAWSAACDQTCCGRGSRLDVSDAFRKSAGSRRVPRIR